MSPSRQRSQRVNQQVEALVEDLVAVIGQQAPAADSGGYPSAQTDPQANATPPTCESQDDPATQPPPQRTWHLAIDTIWAVADVAEATAVGLRACAAHLARLRAAEAAESQTRARKGPPSCKDAESGGGADS